MSAQRHIALVNGRSANHLYHAAADIFEASVTEPIQKAIEKKAQIGLPKTGGYKFKPAKQFQIDGLMSYRSGYTQVAGNPSTKHGGVSTLVTTVVEGLNVLDVLTADRVVGQIFTEHPEYGKGQVPSVSFLGTRIVNLRIGGHKVELNPVLDILGPKPANDESYFDNDDALNNVERQYSILNEAGLPEWAKKDYAWDRAAVRANNKLKCSLFNGVPSNGAAPKAASPNGSSSNGSSKALGHSFGHVIDLPFFGKIFLGELAVTRVPGVGVSAEGIPNPDTYSFHITMIRLKLGCPVVANVNIGTADSNGQGSGGGGVHTGGGGGGH
jgi:hypothetical protein